MNLFDSSVAIDFIGILVIVIMSSCLTEIKKSEAYSGPLAILKWLLISIHILDLVYHLCKINNAVVYPFVYLLLATFFIYLESLFCYFITLFSVKWLIKNHIVKKSINLLLGIPHFVIVILLVANFFTGHFFYINQNGKLIHGFLTDAEFYMMVSYMVLLLGNAVFFYFHSNDKYKKKNCRFILRYNVFPILGMVLEMTIPGLSWVWALSSISFVMLLYNVEQYLVSQERIHEAVSVMGTVFYKILKVNLTTDTFEIIKISEKEITKRADFPLSFSKWMKNFSKNGMVVADDVPSFRQKINIHYLRDYFKTNSDEPFRFRYRRRVPETGEYRWVFLEIIKTASFSQDNQEVMLYVRDINDYYQSEAKQTRDLEISINKDMISGLQSRYAFYERKKQISLKNKAFGIIFADMNGLKRINDNEGHEAGDKYIRDFGNLLGDLFGREQCYRIGGDEFVVIDERKETDFMNSVNKFNQILENQELPVASFGYYWCLTSAGLENALKEAEKIMYDTKAKVHSSHPELDRKN